MIYLKIVVEIVLLIIAYLIGADKGYKVGINEGHICDDCQEEIFMDGYNMGVEDVLAKQEAHLHQIMVTSNFHNNKIEKEATVPKKKTAVKKVAKKKVSKK